MNIRPMVPQDVDRLLVVASRSPGSPQWPRADYEQISASGSADLLRCCWVAMQAETLVGFAVISWLRGDTAAEVESLAVDPDSRRQGLGSALIGVCMGWAAGAGALGIRLEVRASNVAALALYRRRGFAPAGVRRDYYTAPVEDALLLQAKLP